MRMIAWQLLVAALVGAAIALLLGRSEETRGYEHLSEPLDTHGREMLSTLRSIHEELACIQEILSASNRQTVTRPVSEAEARQDRPEAVARELAQTLGLFVRTRDAEIPVSPEPRFADLQSAKERWNRDVGSRREWLFRSSREILRLFGTPTKVEFRDGLERWAYVDGKIEWGGVVFRQDRLIEIW